MVETGKHQNSPSASSNQLKWWKETWSLQLPPRINMFWWQLAWNILPVEKNLASHHVPVQPFCMLSGYAEANTLHAIFECPFVKRAWSDMNICLPKIVDKGVNMLDLLSAIWILNQSFRREVITVLAWAIWKKRCHLVHLLPDERVKILPLRSKDVDWVIGMIDEYRRACLPNLEIKQEAPWNHIARWVSEMGDCLITFTDASFDLGTGKTSAGTVISDKEGIVLDYKHKEIGILETPLEAELRAILFGIHRAKERKKGRIILVSDCLEAVSTIKDEEVIWNRGGHTLNQIMTELSKFDQWRILHIYRRHKEAAHLLASTDCAPSDSLDWVRTKVEDWIQSLRSAIV